ncbi:hypothetical protein BC936DRAFT_144066 [Jimgerdemannia flammicorona]|uniref:Uncharacterized protein n=1 Tax=Jimgerdemannia flammicorona TaxID=994334 RepID=A0A433DD60_9FUNG|nr:hypothetical protein BC936DRAFT_144066 [Jimgerdemannia flammicorona]
MQAQSALPLLSPPRYPDPALRASPPRHLQVGLSLEDTALSPTDQYLQRRLSVGLSVAKHL